MTNRLSLALIGIVLLTACSGTGATSTTSIVEPPPEAVTTSAPAPTTTTTTAPTTTTTSAPATTTTAVEETDRDCGELFVGGDTAKRAVITETDYAGNLAWTATIDRAPGLLNANTEYLFAVDGTELFVIDRRACRIAATDEIANGSFRRELVALLLDDQVWLQDLDTEETLWTIRYPNTIRPHINDNYVALMADPVRLVTLEEGATITEIDVRGELGETAASDTQLFYADGTDLVAVDENAQQLWVATDIGEIEDLEDTPIGVLVTTTANDWILVDLSTGTQIASGADGEGELQYLEGDETAILVYSESGFVRRMAPDGSLTTVSEFIGQGGTAVDGGILFSDDDTGPPDGVETTHWLIDGTGEIIAQFTPDPDASVEIEEDAIIISTVLVDDDE